MAESLRSTRSSKSRSRQSKSDAVPEEEFTFGQLSGFADNFDGNKIGHGLSGEVHYGYSKQHQQIAIKCYGIDPLKKKTWEKEKEALLKLKNCNNIVKYIGFANCDEGHFIVLEHMHGAVTKFLEGLTWKLMLKIIKGTAMGIQEIHKKGLVHGDIKLDNILVDQDFNPKICDFGNTVCEGEGQWIEASTPGYEPPELKKAGPGKKPMDIYCLGIALLRMIRGNPIENAEEMVKDINQAKSSGRNIKGKKRDKSAGETKKSLRRLEVDHKQTPLVMELVVVCTLDTPSQRPKIEEVIQRIQTIEEVLQ